MPWRVSSVFVDWLGAGFRLIGHPAPEWPSEQDHVAELERVAQTDQGLPSPSIIFLWGDFKRK